MIAIGLLAYVGQQLASTGGPHSYDPSAVAPKTVTLTAGATYLLSTAQGPKAAPAATPLRCAYRTTSGLPVQDALAVQPLSGDTRATHAVASFVSPVGGRVMITCSGGTVGSREVFVDNSDAAPGDPAGLLLLLAVVTLLAGSGLLLGGWYAATRPPAPADSGPGVLELQA